MSTDQKDQTFDARMCGSKVFPKHVFRSDSELLNLLKKGEPGGHDIVLTMCDQRKVRDRFDLR